jgi:predicted ATP-grasp superfamily ATP-dependent carboligase
MNILVLDANQRSALAATRSLGLCGFNVTTADECAGALASSSRWSNRAIVYPSPATATGKFLAWAQDCLSAETFDAVLPMTEITTDLLVRHRACWPRITLPFAEIDVIDALSNKVDLYDRAVRLGVPVPPSVVVRSDEDLRRAIDEIGLPAILKPARSRIRQPSGFLSTSVQRVGSMADVETATASAAFRHMPYLYQSLVDGPGRGIFALYREGRAAAFFAHRRIREKPPTGGVSVYSESCLPDPELKAQAERLLDDAGWHGVAMVEFKGRYLMEVNARFWGSLQLAIDANVDFPRLLLQDVPDSEPLASYRTGRRLRWLLGDLDRLYLVFKQTHQRGGAYVLRELARFLIPDPGRTRHEVFRWRDPMPAWCEIRQYVRSLSRGRSSTTLPEPSEV